MYFSTYFIIIGAIIVFTIYLICIYHIIYYDCRGSLEVNNNYRIEWLRRDTIAIILKRDYSDLNAM